MIPVFDTLQLGVNAQHIGNPLNMHNIGQSGVLPNTSIGGNDVTPNGANNTTSIFFENNGTIFNQSSNNSSTVTTSSIGDFLPPTSIGQ